MNKTSTKFVVLIAAGNSDYGPKVGWDALHSSRAEANATAKRARANDGWSAKVIRLTLDEAVHYGWC